MSRNDNSIATQSAQKVMATQLENDTFATIDEEFFQYTLPNYYRTFLKKFRKITQSIALFHTLFLSIILLEITGFAIFLSSLKNSLSLAVFLCAIILSCFSYLVLFFYFQTKKPEQILVLQEDFIQSCRHLSPEGRLHHHLLIAEAASRLFHYLTDFEWEIYQIPSYLQFSTNVVSRFSAYIHFEDVFQMKEWLLKAAIEEHLKQIRIIPTDLEVHASLANTYVALAKLYKNPIIRTEHPRWNFIKKTSVKFEQLSKTYSHLAIEEFKILSHYAKDDPWVHEQMASGYKELDLPLEEICEIETLLKLRPQDKEILFRLGSLYFSQGFNAKGLQVYESLKQTNYKKAEDLIASYGKGDR